MKVVEVVNSNSNSKSKYNCNCNSKYCNIKININRNKNNTNMKRGAIIVEDDISLKKKKIDPLDTIHYRIRTADRIVDDGVIQVSIKSTTLKQLKQKIGTKSSINITTLL